MDKTFGIALVPVLGGAMPSGTPVTVRGRGLIYYGLQAVIFGANKLLEGLNDVGGGGL